MLNKGESFQALFPWSCGCVVTVSNRRGQPRLLLPRVAGAKGESIATDSLFCYQLLPAPNNPQDFLEEEALALKEVCACSEH